MSWRSFSRQLATVVGFASASVGLWLAYSRWIQNTPQEARAGFYVISCLAVLLLFLVLFLEYRYARKARYAEGLENLLAGARSVTASRLESTADCRMVMDRVIQEISE